MAQLGVGECGMTGTEDSDYREQDVRELRADLETRAELAAVGRAIECFLGVEYGTPVESARALVERCADAERALDGIRAERDEWWRHFLGRQRGYSDALRGMARRATALRRDRDQVHNQFLDHYNVASVQLDRVLELEEGLRERTDQRDKAVQDARGERHVRRLNELALLGQLSAERESRFRWAEEAGEMAARRDEARADAHRAARYYADQATRRATELAALRSIAVVLPEDWRQMLADGDYPEQVVDLIESWRAAPVVEFEAADSPSPVSKSSQTAAPAEAETPARPTGMVYLLDQYDRLLSAVEHIRMDTPEDRDRHARVIATFRRAAEPVREQVEGAAPPEVEITDEHVREHDDAAPNRDKVVEAWADTWDGVDRTSEWVRVVEPCPVPDCTIPQVHGHEGYGLRFTPAAKPAPQGEPDEDWCGRFADDGKHYCPEGHNTVYQMFSGGREWYCADCGTQGTYPPAPADVGPRARLLTQPGGAAELKRQMDEHLASPGTGTEAGE